MKIETLGLAARNRSVAARNLLEENLEFLALDFDGLTNFFAGLRAKDWGFLEQLYAKHPAFDTATFWQYVNWHDKTGLYVTADRWREAYDKGGISVSDLRTLDVEIVERFLKYLPEVQVYPFLLANPNLWKNVFIDAKVMEKFPIEDLADIILNRRKDLLNNLSDADISQCAFNVLFDQRAHDLDCETYIKILNLGGDSKQLLSLLNREDFDTSLIPLIDHPKMYEVLVKSGKARPEDYREMLSKNLWVYGIPDMYLSELGTEGVLKLYKENPNVHIWHFICKQTDVSTEKCLALGPDFHKEHREVLFSRPDFPVEVMVSKEYFDFLLRDEFTAEDVKFYLANYSRPNEMEGTAAHDLFTRECECDDYDEDEGQYTNCDCDIPYSLLCVAAAKLHKEQAVCFTKETRHAAYLYAKRPDVSALEASKVAHKEDVLNVLLQKPDATDELIKSVCDKFTK
jgi:hypothetical protein